MELILGSWGLEAIIGLRGLKEFKLLVPSSGVTIRERVCPYGTSYMRWDAKHFTRKDFEKVARSFADLLTQPKPIRAGDTQQMVSYYKKHKSTLVDEN